MIGGERAKLHAVGRIKTIAYTSCKNTAEENFKVHLARCLWRVEQKGERGGREDSSEFLASAIIASGSLQWICHGARNALRQPRTFPSTFAREELTFAWRLIHLITRQAIRELTTFRVTAFSSLSSVPYVKIFRIQFVYVLYPCRLRLGHCALLCNFICSFQQQNYIPSVPISRAEKKRNCF